MTTLTRPIPTADPAGVIPNRPATRPPGAGEGPRRRDGGFDAPFDAARPDRLPCRPMRRTGWLLLTTFALALFGAGAAARAQVAPNAAGGDVVQIGFDGNFQPTGWVPMKVRLTPPGGQSGLYRLRVHQVDLDGDNVVFERLVTLTGGMTNQEFWTYFKPQPVDPLPANDVNVLRQRLRVVLADEGGRELAQLKINRPVIPLSSGPGGVTERGQRLTLMVSNPAGGFLAGGGEMAPGASVGYTEDTLPVGVTTDDLPDRSIGYDGVSAVVWQDADPAVLTQGAGERMTALRQWVRGGGHLVVTARAEWQSLEAFGDLLPVTPTGASEEPDLTPLLPLVEGGRGRVPLAPWRQARGPFRFILSTAKPETLVEQTFPYGPAPATRAAESDAVGGVEGGVAEGADKSKDARPTAPLLARMPYGFGCVTWVALDPSNRNVLGPPANRTAGWSGFWSTVFGTGDTPILNPNQLEKARFDARQFQDLGAALLPGTRLAGRSVALVTIALVFFVAYWLIAGPGLYFFLASRKRTSLSWFAFGAAALIATALTLGVVRLVLSGSAELRHVSVARQGRVAPEVTHSEVGLYIPRDGEQRLSVDGGAAGTLPTITAFDVDPAHRGGEGGRTNPINYTVPLDPPEQDVRGGLEGAAAVVEVPYRSTLKKLEIDRVGPVTRGIDGLPRLIRGGGLVTGSLANSTGRDLKDVYICFRHPLMRDDPVLIYLPSWRNGTTLPGLDQLLVPPDGSPRMRRVNRRPGTGEGPPTRQQAVWGQLRRDWAPLYFYTFLRSGLLQGGNILFEQDWTADPAIGPVMLSLFTLLPPMTNEAAVNSGNFDATMPLRRGAHELDVSPAVLAGRMVIVAQTADDAAPLPVPLRVNGTPTPGEGRTIFQVVLPVDRSGLDATEPEPTTRPSDSDGMEVPTTQQ